MTQLERCLRFRRAAVSSCALCLLVSACNEPPRERAAERSERTKLVASEEEAQRAPAKPTSPIAAPGAAEPPPRASEVPQRLSPSDDLPSSKQLPVAEDFQAETTAAIVRGNYHSELDSLESEVKSDSQ